MSKIKTLHGTYMEPAGYYVIGDDGEPLGISLCTDCFIDNLKRENPLADMSDIQGQEPIGYWHETDTPVHCESCEALLVTTLTEYGVRYVQSLINEGASAPLRDAWMRAFDLDEYCGNCGDQLTYETSSHNLNELCDEKALLPMRCCFCYNELFDESCDCDGEGDQS
jgi:hypothetical protein